MLNLPEAEIGAEAATDRLRFRQHRINCLSPRADRVSSGPIETHGSQVFRQSAHQADRLVVRFS